MNHFKHKLQLLLLLIFPMTMQATGTVYLVFGSDTAIWQGMSTPQYNCTYDLSLYTNAERNAYAAMDPAFRAQMLDSYNQPMKMTWWMMAGNIFRYATNNDVPVNNIMTLYLMQKYHGEEVLINGDELSIHYHTFFWSDYDRDGLSFWNQALTFEESKADWDVTLAQFLLEEDVFPVSFRSGWHYMDNTWQHELNNILPYSMHNAWPANHVDTEEPLDNTYNWSESPSAFVPFRPSLDNYMIPGDGPGWNVRSSSFQQVINYGYMDTVFNHASQGRDQLACFWAHLPETDFVENMATMHDLATAASEIYPDVEFRYCSAIEAMQLWRGNLDTIPPEVTFQINGVAGSREINISSNETLFQPNPFVAAKYKDGSYRVLSSELTSENHWQILDIPFDVELAKLAVAATDTMGNLTTHSISVIPDDIYLDNLDPQYTELSGSWATQEDAAWGIDSRSASVTTEQPASYAWSIELQGDSYYHIHTQVTDQDEPHAPISISVTSASGSDTYTLNPPFEAKQWLYVATPYLSGSQVTIAVESAVPDSINNAILCGDVIKLSASVREKDLHLSTRHLEFGEISQGEHFSRTIQLENRGLNALNIESLTLNNDLLQLNRSAPFSITPMATVELVLSIDPIDPGVFNDTLHLTCDDPLNGQVDISIDGTVGYPFRIVDNEDMSNYMEYGPWATSVAVAHGTSSRYVYLGESGSAVFTSQLDYQGLYDVSEIVPRTVNSADQALYTIEIDDVTIDSVYLNQNEGSGNWVLVGRYYFPAATPIKIGVRDDGSSSSGPVLRADAIKFQMVHPLALSEESSFLLPDAISLKQNYPNPFNPATTIRFELGSSEHVQLKIYDLQGRMIRTLVDEHQLKGQHELIWNSLDQSGNSMSAGVYLCQLTTTNDTQTIKMLLLK